MFGELEICTWCGDILKTGIRTIIVFDVCLELCLDTAAEKFVV